MEYFGILSITVAIYYGLILLTILKVTVNLNMLLIMLEAVLTFMGISYIFELVKKLLMLF